MQFQKGLCAFEVKSTKKFHLGPGAIIYHRSTLDLRVLLVVGAKVGKDIKSCLRNALSGF
jgi:hypothetical protein